MEREGWAVWSRWLCGNRDRVVSAGGGEAGCPIFVWIRRMAKLYMEISVWGCVWIREKNSVCAVAQRGHN